MDNSSGIWQAVPEADRLQSNSILFPGFFPLQEDRNHLPQQEHPRNVPLHNLPWTFLWGSGFSLSSQHVRSPHVHRQELYLLLRQEPRSDLNWHLHLQPVQVFSQRYWISIPHNVVFPTPPFPATAITCAIKRAPPDFISVMPAHKGGA